MSFGYGNYNAYNGGGSNPNYYQDFEPDRAQDAYGTYAYQGSGGGSYSGSYDQSYINQATGMNPYFSNAMQMQWQTMQHFYSTDSYGGRGDGSGSYESDSGWNGGQRSVNNLHPYHQDQDSARPHKRHKNRDSRPSSSQRESDRPHVSAPFVNMTSFPSQHHRNSSPRSSSPPSASPAPPPPSSPSPSYLELSKTPLETISSPSTSRKLLILDLNGTLVLRSPRPQGKTTYNSQQRPAPRAVYPRPYMGVFREWMFHKVNREWLDVMVWSSAQPHSVNDMVQQAFGEEGKMLKAIWARDKMGLGADVYHQKVQTIKDLAKPWAELASLSSSRSPSPNPNTRRPETLSPSSPVTHSALTTLLLDDSSRKAILQPYNHVIIKEYTRGMRNADLASLAAEARRNQIAAAAAAAAKKEETDTYSIASSSASSPAPAVDAVVVESEGGDENDQKPKKKRKEKKSKKVQEEVDAADGDIVFDETLLAIIGILNDAKFQSNIAAWARNGGLWGPYASSMLEQQERERSLAEAGAECGVPHHVVTNGQDNGEAADADVPVGEESEVTVQGTPPVWYEHPGTVIYWSTKGRESLQELGIEIRHGLVER